MALQINKRLARLIRKAIFYYGGIGAFIHWAPWRLSIIADELSKQLHDMFGTYGWRIYDLQLHDKLVYENGRWTKEYEKLILDRVILRDKDQQKFLDYLYDNIVSEFYSRRYISGNWGQIVVRANGDLAYEIREHGDDGDY